MDKLIFLGGLAALVTASPLAQGPSSAYQPVQGRQSYQGPPSVQPVQGFQAPGVQGPQPVQQFQWYPNTQGRQSYQGPPSVQPAQGFQGYPNTQGRQFVLAPAGFQVRQSHTGPTGYEEQRQPHMGPTGFQPFQRFLGPQPAQGFQNFPSQQFVPRQGFTGHQGGRDNSWENSIVRGTPTGSANNAPTVVVNVYEAGHPSNPTMPGRAPLPTDAGYMSTFSGLLKALQDLANKLSLQISRSALEVTGAAGAGATTPAPAVADNVTEKIDLVTEGCLQCMCEGSEGECRDIECDEVDEGACGPFNIHNPFWQDGGSLQPAEEKRTTGDDFRDCSSDLQCSKDTARNYYNRYAKDCDGDGLITCRDFFSLHHYGPGGCQPVGPNLTPAQKMPESRHYKFNECVKALGEPSLW